MMTRLAIVAALTLSACATEATTSTVQAVHVDGPEVGVEPALYEVTLLLDGDQLARMAGLFTQIYPRYYVASGWDYEHDLPVWVPAIDYSELDAYRTSATTVEVSNAVMPAWCSLWY